MEYCWLYPWVVVLGSGAYGDPDPLLGPGWAFLLMLGGQLLTRSVLARGGSLRRARGFLVCTGVVLGFLSVRAQHYQGIPAWNPAWIGALLRAAHDTLPAVPKPVLAALAAAALWWRGLALGTRDTDAGGIEAAYKTGVAAVVVYFLAAAIYADTAGFRAAGPAMPGSMPAFFLLGLSALALARLAVIWDRGQPDERAHFPVRGWALLIVGIVGLILLVASMSAGLAAADIFTYVGLALRPLLPVLEVVFLMLFFVAEILARVIIAILSRIPQRGGREAIPPSAGLDDLLRRLREINVHPTVVEGARWSMVLLATILLCLGMALTVVLMRRRAGQPDEDEHESVWSTRGLLRGLGGLVPRFRSRRAPADEPLDPAIRSLRRIYRELLVLGRTAGAPRHPATTPREYNPRLTGALPAAAAEIATLTEAYERVRYGGWRPPRGCGGGGQRGPGPGQGRHAFRAVRLATTALTASSMVSATGPGRPRVDMDAAPGPPHTIVTPPRLLWSPSTASCAAIQGSRCSGIVAATTATRAPNRSTAASVASTGVAWPRLTTGTPRRRSSMVTASSPSSWSSPGAQAQMTGERPGVT